MLKATIPGTVFTPSKLLSEVTAIMYLTADYDVDSTDDSFIFLFEEQHSDLIHIVLKRILRKGYNVIEFSTTNEYQ